MPRHAKRTISKPAQTEADSQVDKPEEIIRKLVDKMRDPNAPDMARVDAAKRILEIGYGPPRQQVKVRFIK